MRTALIVVDLQHSFRERPNWTAINHPDIVDRAQRLVDHARDRGWLVVWVLHSEPGTGTVWDPKSGYVRLMDEVEPRSDEPTVVKTSINAFTSTDLSAVLTRHQVTDVVVCGLQTEQCCETTTRVAADLGYAVTFVLDATATFPIGDPAQPADRPLAELLADPTTLHPDQIVERTRYALARRFADVRTLDEVLGASATVAA